MPSCWRSSKPPKLTFAAAADKRTLIRRATFDLTGLPPTPAEIDAFVKDTSPNAYEKLVDRLLASPRFGERAALFWLDVVRYAESDGFKADDPRPNAWRYRDYVIDSFNADKPYDRFVREQLAGDELFPGDPDALIATGFLRHYPYEYNAVDVEKKRIDILNDITDTTAAAFLGLTLGCAKCHDHKTDPVTQEDYYRFQAFYAGYWPTEAPVGDDHGKYAAWEAKTAEVRERIAELEKPHREKEAARQRKRQQEVYAKLLDIPEADRTPWQKQIAAMVEQQVYEREGGLVQEDEGDGEGAVRSADEGARRAVEDEAPRPAGGDDHDRRRPGRPADQAADARQLEPAGQRGRARVPVGDRRPRRGGAADAAADHRPAVGAGEVDRVGGQPADGAGGGEPGLAAALRPRDRGECVGLRRDRRPADAPGVARLAGDCGAVQAHRTAGGL